MAYQRYHSPSMGSSNRGGRGRGRPMTNTSAQEIPNQGPNFQFASMPRSSPTGWRNYRPPTTPVPIPWQPMTARFPTERSRNGYPNEDWRTGSPNERYRMSVSNNIQSVPPNSIDSESTTAIPVTAATKRTTRSTIAAAPITTQTVTLSPTAASKTETMPASTAVSAASTTTKSISVLLEKRSSQPPTVARATAAEATTTATVTPATMAEHTLPATVAPTTVPEHPTSTTLAPSTMAEPTLPATVVPESRTSAAVTTSETSTTVAGYVTTLPPEIYISTPTTLDTAVEAPTTLTSNVTTPASVAAGAGNRRWLVGCRALMEVKTALVPVIASTIRRFHEEVLAATQALPRCDACTSETIAKKTAKNQRDSPAECPLHDHMLDALVGQHSAYKKTPFRIDWASTNVPAWDADYWQFAKVFMGRGIPVDNRGPDDTDPYNLLVLMNNCSLFKAKVVSNMDLVQKVISVRNSIMHAPQMSLDEPAMLTHLADMLGLLQDRVLCQDQRINQGIRNLTEITNSVQLDTEPELRDRVQLMAKEMASYHGRWLSSEERQVVRMLSEGMACQLPRQASDTDTTLLQQQLDDYKSELHSLKDCIMNGNQTRTEDPGYGRWLLVGLGFLKVKDTLIQIIRFVLKRFHQELTSLADNIPFVCDPSPALCSKEASCPRREAILKHLRAHQASPSPHHDLTCALVMKWTSNDWELARFYTNGGIVTTSVEPEDTDLRSLLDLLQQCTLFQSISRKTAFTEEVATLYDTVFTGVPMYLDAKSMNEHVSAVEALLEELKGVVDDSPVELGLEALMAEASPKPPVHIDDEVRVLQHRVQSLEARIQSPQVSKVERAAMETRRFLDEKTNFNKMFENVKHWKTFYDLRHRLESRYHDSLGNISPIPDIPRRLDLKCVYTTLTLTSGIHKTKFGSPEIDNRVFGEKDIFTPIDSMCVPRRILLEGAPGIGKSTLCHKLATSWATAHTDDEDLFGSHAAITRSVESFGLLLFLKARDLSQSDIYDSIIQSLLGDEWHDRKDELRACLNYFQTCTLLIIDGCDEAQDVRRLLDDLLEGTLLRKTTKLITSRPTFLSYQMQYFDLVFLNEGFRRDSQEEFVERFFRVVRSQHSSREDVLALMDKDVQMEELCRTPLYLTLMCILTSQAGHTLSGTQTQLYAELLDFTKEKAIQRMGYDQPTVTMLINLLQKISFRLLQTDEYIITEDLVREIDGSTSTVDRMKDLGCVGLLTLESSLKKLSTNMTAMFVHRSFMEFLAARHILSWSAEERDEFLRPIITCSGDYRRFENTLVFFLGLSSETDGQAACQLLQIWASQQYTMYHNEMSPQDFANYLEQKQSTYQKTHSFRHSILHWLRDVHTDNPAFIASCMKSLPQLRLFVFSDLCNDSCTKGFLTLGVIVANCKEQFPEYNCRLDVMLRGSDHEKTAYHLHFLSELNKSPAVERLIICSMHNDAPNPIELVLTDSTITSVVSMKSGCSNFTLQLGQATQSFAFIDEHDEDYVKRTLESLKICPRLRQLDFINTRMENSVEVVELLLRDSAHLEQFSLLVSGWWSMMGRPPRVLSKIMRCKKLKYLHMNSLNDDQDWDDLYTIVERKQLVALSVNAYNTIKGDQEVVHPDVKALITNSNLQSLQILRNHLVENSTKRLIYGLTADMVASFPKLRSLDLSGIYLTHFEEETTNIPPVLLQPWNMKDLQVHIKDAHAFDALAMVFSPDSVLERLQINGSGQDGRFKLDILASKILNLKRLRDFRLIGCFFREDEPDEFEDLCKRLGQLGALEVLKFQKCDLFDDHLRPLGEAVVANHNIKYVDLTWNRFKSSGCSFMEELLARSNRPRLPSVRMAPNLHVNHSLG